MKKIFVFTLTLCLIPFMFIGCQNQNEDICTEWEWSNDIFWEMYNDGIVQQGQYASRMRFETPLVWDELDWTNFRNYRGREIIFVHSEEEAVTFGYTLDVIVGWPSVYSLGIMGGINNLEDINLEDFGLPAQLTAEDLVYNWELISNLWLEGIGRDRREAIVVRLRGTYGLEEFDNWQLRRWLFPGVLDILNELIEDRDITDVDLERINRNRTNEITVEDLPTWPITEADVHSNPELVFRVASDLLTGFEMQSLIPENIVRAQQCP